MKARGPKPLTKAQLDDVIGGASLLGTAGDDTLNGGVERDILSGGDGHDALDGGAGDRAADNVYGGDGNDSYVWAPGDGNDSFHGGRGFDALRVTGMSLEDLKSALTVQGDLSDNVEIHVRGNVLMFTVQGGPPTAVSGSITYGGERIYFYQIEEIWLQPDRANSPVFPGDSLG